MCYLYLFKYLKNNVFLNCAINKIARAPLQNWENAYKYTKIYVIYLLNFPIYIQYEKLIIEKCKNMLHTYFHY